MKISHAIVFSIFGHGMLFMSWPHVANFSVASTLPSYQVTLLESKTKNVISKTIQTNSPQIIKTPQKNKYKADNKRSAKAAAERKNNVSTSDKKSEIKAYIISHINHKIRNDFYYPQLARRNGWEGKVLLSLNVTAEGLIKNAQIKAGSGYPILDQSALNALLKIKAIQNTENWFNINNQNIIIPVIYRLQKG
ncbi:MAG: TonB family protein [Gammaproteobacteria bacterium]|nr:TonB family protein [Gammaproteobacteria bacterium]